MRFDTAVCHPPSVSRVRCRIEAHAPPCRHTLGRKVAVASSHYPSRREVPVKKLSLVVATFPVEKVLILVIVLIGGLAIACGEVEEVDSPSTSALTEELELTKSVTFKESVAGCPTVDADEHKIQESLREVIAFKIKGVLANPETYEEGDMFPIVAEKTER